VTARHSVSIHADAVQLTGDLVVPGDAGGVVVFAHGSGSSRLSPRNRSVAERLNADGLATLMFDLLTPNEAVDRALVFDIQLLASRLRAAVAATREVSDLRGLPPAFFGASTGAAAALVAATSVGVGAIVSRGGRPDLAGPALEDVASPTLLIVGSNDVEVLELNRQARNQMRAETRLEVIGGAGHLFEEPGALERVAELASAWFTRYLAEPVGSSG
jgi:putative phosphoribosyl transferase